MKKTLLHTVLLAALCGATAAHAGEFDRSWLGLKAGNNSSSVTGLDTQNVTTYGIEVGHNWDMGGFLLGANAFYDANDKATHSPGLINYGSDAYGVDAKFGLNAGKWLPYAKLGYAQTNGNAGAGAISGGDAHLGLGVEYKFAPSWSLAGEYTTASAKTAGSKLTNNNLTLGVNYYFGATPAPVAAPAKAEPAPAPVAKAAPAPKEAWQIIKEEKPVRIEGASFDTNSAKLKPTADAKLQQVVEFANKYPEANIEVAGHTDDRGKDAYNMKLSEKRAAAVKASLVKKGIEADRIEATGYGESKPLADNKTKEGRAANRRVEVGYTIRSEKKVRVQ